MSEARVSASTDVNQHVTAAVVIPLLSSAWNLETPCEMMLPPFLVDCFFNSRTERRSVNVVLTHHNEERSKLYKKVCFILIWAKRLAEPPQAKRGSINTRRIKNKQNIMKYRPFKTTEELIEEHEKRFPNKPCVWLKHRYFKENLLVIGFDEQFIRVADNNVSLSALLDRYTFRDGSPCGIREEV